MKCLFGDNPEEACGYPPKTVRAIISVSACLISFGLFSFLVIFFAFKERYTEVMSVIGIIATELGTIVGYYFGVRASEEKEKILDERERLLEEKRALRNNLREEKRKSRKKKRHN